MSAIPLVSRPQLVVGTAGHIDHGKSSLVRALTGIDPDRLPEEKARGMTIDLGFAHASFDGCDIWFVDVPGHERFIRNMLAGATGIDVALLVVAGDDSVMPQTREHAELLSLLGVQRCLVVVTKADLVDEDWAAAVEDEAVAMLANCGLTPVGAVRTSAKTGAGLSKIREVLLRLAHDPIVRESGARWFCLPIDRAFSVPGRGTVVTGSVAHGTVRKGDELTLWPADRRVIVRELQAHHDQRDQADGRMRLALNLTGCELAEVERGCTLATPEFLQLTSCCDVVLAWFQMPGKRIQQRSRLRLHLGTREVLCELRLPEKPGEHRVRAAYAQLYPAEPIVAAWGQRFVLRDEAANRTLGGGRIVHFGSQRWSARVVPNPTALQRLDFGTADERLETVLSEGGLVIRNPVLLAGLAGLPDGEAALAALNRLAAERRIKTIPVGASVLYATRSKLDALIGDLTGRLQRHVIQNPLTAGIPLAEWRHWMPRSCPVNLRIALAEWLVEQGAVAVTSGHVMPAGPQKKLASDDQALLEEILAEFQAAGLQPPAPEQLRCHSVRNENRIKKLFEFAAAQRKLLHLEGGLWIHSAVWLAAARKVRAVIEVRGPLTVSELKTELGVSRKYALPLLVSFDAQGVTRRRGDRRELGPKLPASGL